jgi:branched-subunit amino acid aminotransferase/4-amino-4-deoxychorismate lyase
MSVASIYRWHGGQLVGLDYCDPADTAIVVADSWLVTEGSTLAIGLHRARFLAGVPTEAASAGAQDAEAFFAASLALIPRDGDWFPRVELQRRGDGYLFVFHLRSAPELASSVAVASWAGADPRTTPAIKGPDLEALTRVATSVQSVGAREAIILTPEGYVVEGSRTGLLWWRGDILCGPPAEFARVASVSVRSILTLAAALGVETYEEAVTPAELDGTELWAANALHGIRIVTNWHDGPSVAELPGRLSAWRARMDALRRPI